MIRLALPLAALAMSGCDPVPPPETPALSGECKADGLDALVGRERSAGVEAEAKRLSGAKVVRWLEPDSVVTMEYRADRVNLVLGTDGKIASARCG